MPHPVETSRRIIFAAIFTGCSGKTVRLWICEDHWREILSSVASWHTCLPR